MHTSTEHAYGLYCIVTMCNHCHMLCTTLCKLACIVLCTLMCLSGRRRDAENVICVVSGPATRASQGLIDVERQGMAPATVSRDACALSDCRWKVRNAAARAHERERAHRACRAARSSIMRTRELLGRGGARLIGFS